MFNPKGRDVSIIIDSDELAWRHATSTQELEYTLTNDPYIMFGIDIPTVFTQRDLSKIRDEVNRHNGTAHTNAKILEELNPEVSLVHKGRDELIASNIVNSYLKPIVSNVTTHKVSYTISYCHSMDKTNIRHSIAPLIPYKQNRGAVHYDIDHSRNAIRQAIISERYGFPIAITKINNDIGVETDDIVAGLVFKANCISGEYPVILGRDKDFLQLPEVLIARAKYKGTGTDYTYLSAREALVGLLYQWLKGDTADNIKGAPGIGHLKAMHILVRVNYTTPINPIVSCIEEEYIAACRNKAKKLGLNHSEDEIDMFALNLCYDTFLCLWLYDAPNLNMLKGYSDKELTLTKKREIIVDLLKERYT